MNAAKVWVVNTKNHDYSAASKFGEITPVFVGNVYIFDVHSVVEDTKRMLDAHAGPDDYVLLSGYTFLNLIVGYYFLQRFGRIKSLIFAQRKKEYRPLTLYRFGVEQDHKIQAPQNQQKETEHDHDPTVS